MAPGSHAVPPSGPADVLIAAPFPTNYNGGPLFSGFVGGLVPILFLGTRTSLGSVLHRPRRISPRSDDGSVCPRIKDRRPAE
eukprot:9670220-Heterocapsa_arctica.AAC.1